MGNLLHLRDPVRFCQKQRPGIQLQCSYSSSLYCVLSLLIDLGYTIGIAKSVLYPTTSVEYLGLRVDSLKQAFIVPGCKIEALAVLRKNHLRL